jgi:hypothetical protein
LDMMKEEIVAFRKAAVFVPSRPHVSTLHRWRQRGIRGVRLDAVLVGGVWYTSREAIRRFIECATAAADDQQHIPSQQPQPIDTDAGTERRLNEYGL